MFSLQSPLLMVKASQSPDLLCFLTPFQLRWHLAIGHQEGSNPRRRQRCWDHGPRHPWRAPREGRSMPQRVAEAAGHAPKPGGRGAAGAGGRKKLQMDPEGSGKIWGGFSQRFHPKDTAPKGFTRGDRDIDFVVNKRSQQWSQIQKPPTILGVHNSTFH